MGVATIAVQVLSGVQLHQRRNKCNNYKNGHGESVDVLADVESYSTVLPPCPGSDDWSNVCLFRSTIHSLNPFFCCTYSKNERTDH